MTEELLLCQCSDPAHQLIMFYDDDVEAPAVYVSVHLSPEPNFFKRLWNGLKYIFGSKRSIYGDFDEIILRPTDVDKLRKAVDVLESINHKTNVPLFVEQEKLS
jgi:hypothetical protein